LSLDLVKSHRVRITDNDLRHACDHRPDELPAAAATCPSGVRFNHCVLLSVTVSFRTVMTPSEEATMKRVFGVVLSALAATALLVPFTPAAHAATGQVVVFSVEITPLETYDNPRGCKLLPVGAHVLANLTDGDVTIYSDAACLAPLATVEPGYGTHVPAYGATFKA
jgi:hypothetical protein